VNLGQGGGVRSNGKECEGLTFSSIIITACIGETGQCTLKANGQRHGKKSSQGGKGEQVKKCGNKEYDYWGSDD